MTDHDFVTYVGTVGQLVEKKSGWYTVQIQVPGKQYPIKADTKLENLLDKAREVRDAGAVATFTIEEWDSDNINPNNNQPYRERRLSGIEYGAPAPAGGTGTGGGADVTPHHDPIADADRQRLITRQTCLKVAAQVYQGQGLSKGASDWDVPLDVMKAAGRFENWLYRDIDPPPSSSGHEAAPVPDSAPPVAEEEIERLAAEYGQGNIPTDDIPY